MSTIEDFRRETRAWLEASCPQSMRSPMPDGDLVWGGRTVEFKTEDQRLWFERMRDKGWFCPDWPAAYGGGLFCHNHDIPDCFQIVVGRRRPCRLR